MLLGKDQVARHEGRGLRPVRYIGAFLLYLYHMEIIKFQLCVAAATVMFCLIGYTLHWWLSWRRLRRIVRDSERRRELRTASPKSSGDEK